MNKREIVVDIVRALLMLGFSAYEKRKQKKQRKEPVDNQDGLG